MEVLLLKDVPKLGNTGDIVRVADGYARNYLIPRQLAAPATEGARRQAELLRAQEERKRERAARQAAALAQRLDGMMITVRQRAGEQGRLYGSVTASDIAAALEAQHGVEVDRRRIVLDEPIRELGQYAVEVRLTAEAVAHVAVVVEPEQEQAQGA